MKTTQNTQLTDALQKLCSKMLHLQMTGFEWQKDMELPNTQLTLKILS